MGKNIGSLTRNDSPTELTVRKLQFNHLDQKQPVLCQAKRRRAFNRSRLSSKTQLDIAGRSNINKYTTKNITISRVGVDQNCVYVKN